MNILILNWKDIKNPTSGGAEIVTYEHAKSWVKAGHSVTWLASSYKNLKKEEKIDGISIRRFGNIYGVYLYAPFFYHFSGNKFDLVVDEVHGIPFFTPLYVRSVPIFVLIHEVAGEIWNYMYRFPVNVLGRIFENFIFIPYRNITFMTVSKSTSQELKKMGINKINIIENGVRVINVKDINKETKPTFIFVSRVVKMKGIVDVIKAFNIIVNELKDAQLWIVGGGDPKYKKQLMLEIDRYGIGNKIKFFGKVTEIKKFNLMKRAHLLMHASVKEGWGLVILEAASQGTPSVVYNVSGLRDSVVNKKTGIITSKNSPLEMADEALKLISDNFIYSKMQLESIKWSKIHTWEKSTNKSKRLLRQVLSE